jgi:predicted DsbA family dithiol-disulfide isomerase
MSKSKKSIEVNIWSDIACPWCYVGEKIFKKAMIKFNKNYPEISVIPIFHAYMIDPGTKIEGEEYLSYNKRRWGNDNWTHQLKSMGKKYGAYFSNWKIWPNTLLSHKLMAEANKKGKGNEVLDEIFKYCYEMGKNVSIESTLDEIGNKFGIKNWNNDENLKLVLKDEKIGKNHYGIGGVPFFIFPNDEVIEGAAEDKTFLNALIQAMESL